MNFENAEVQSFRELNIEEIAAVSGGVKWECKVSISSDGTKTVSCTVSGTL